MDENAGEDSTIVLGDFSYIELQYTSAIESRFLSNINFDSQSSLINLRKLIFVFSEKFKQIEIDY